MKIKNIFIGVFLLANSAFAQDFEADKSHFQSSLARIQGGADKDLIEAEPTTVFEAYVEANPINTCAEALINTIQRSFGIEVTGNSSRAARETVTDGTSSSADASTLNLTINYPGLKALRLGRWDYSSDRAGYKCIVEVPKKTLPIVEDYLTVLHIKKNPPVGINSIDQSIYTLKTAAARLRARGRADLAGDADNLVDQLGEEKDKARITKGNLAVRIVCNPCAAKKCNSVIALVQSAAIPISEVRWESNLSRSGIYFTYTETKTLLQNIFNTKYDLIESPMPRRYGLAAIISVSDTMASFRSMLSRFMPSACSIPEPVAPPVVYNPSPISTSSPVATTRPRKSANEAALGRTKKPILVKTAFGENRLVKKGKAVRVLRRSKDYPDRVLIAVMDSSPFAGYVDIADIAGVAKLPPGYSAFKAGLKETVTLTDALSQKDYKVKNRSSVYIIQSSDTFCWVMGPRRWAIGQISTTALSGQGDTD